MNDIQKGFFAIYVSLVSSFVFAASSERQVFFGDTHLHSSFSFDSFTYGNETAGPDTAYRYAKGLPVVHPGHRARVRIGTPLDFLIVADHAEMMGTLNRLSQRSSEYLASEEGRGLVDKFFTTEGREEITKEFFRLQRGSVAERPGMGLDNPQATKSIWEESYTIAEHHNEPGKFTAFIGWEWSANSEGNTLHRVVFMPEGPEVASRFVPFSSYDSKRPEDLWRWLDNLSAETGADFMAIPHNSNLSSGRAFSLKDSNGQPFTTEYIRQRTKWEPLVEVTQSKGDSETYPSLSPNDEFADFERFDNGLIKVIDGGVIVRRPIEPGSYVRPSLLEGLRTEVALGANPFKFGMIGSSDQHAGLPSPEEDNFQGKFTRDSTPYKASEPYGIWQNRGWDFSASGLAAVWAEENTRQSLFAAFKRKEVYATTGTRMRVRFFGGWDFNQHDAKRKNLAETGYQKGVPMGGDLTQAPKGKAPTFLVVAAKDPVGANLDRIQIVKGWIDENSQAREKIFNVALADNRKPDAEGNVTVVGNTVDLATASYTNTIGDAQLVTVWKDKEFNPDQSAFYYVRVLEIPTPRHSLYDAVALDIEHPEEYPAGIQERAYSSPIWYTP